jgi:hypothetical protein
MNCTKCGSLVQAGDKFCSQCGAPAGSQYCPNCGKQITPGAVFCSNCGKNLQGNAPPQAINAQPQYTPPVNAGAAPVKSAPAAEGVLMDTGTFPIAYIKNIMSSVNGKLSLTSHYLVFKASALQGVGGVAAGGMFIPNPADAMKSTQHFSIPLSSVTTMERGWSHITVHASGQKFKFGGMTKTKEWEAAINNARAHA